LIYFYFLKVEICFSHWLKRKVNASIKSFFYFRLLQLFINSSFNQLFFWLSASFYFPNLLFLSCNFLLYFSKIAILYFSYFISSCIVACLFCHYSFYVWTLTSYLFIFSLFKIINEFCCSNCISCLFLSFNFFIYSSLSFSSLFLSNYISLQMAWSHHWLCSCILYKSCCNFLMWSSNCCSFSSLSSSNWCKFYISSSITTNCYLNMAYFYYNWATFLFYYSTVALNSY